MFKKLLRRELGLKPYNYNICYVAIKNPYALFGESIMEEMFTCKYDTNVNLYNAVAYEREEEAVANAFSEITSNYELYREVFNENLIKRIDENRDESDLKKGAYCVVAVRGRAKEITSLLSLKNTNSPYNFNVKHGIGFGERVLSARDNTGTIVLFRDEVLENIGKKKFSK
jgi:hypothetical protein